MGRTAENMTWEQRCARMLGWYLLYYRVLFFHSTPQHTETWVFEFNLPHCHASQTGRVCLLVDHMPWHRFFGSIIAAGVGSFFFLADRTVGSGKSGIVRLFLGKSASFHFENVATIHSLLKFDTNTTTCDLPRSLNL